MQNAWIILIALLVPAAGCLGGDEGAPTPAASAEPTTASSELNETDLEAGVEEAPARPVPVAVNVSFDGETGTFLCYGSPAGMGCQGQFSSTSHQELAHTGTPLSLVGTLTWEASSPAARTLQVRVFVMENGEPVYNETAPVAEGGSPLDFMFDLTPFAGQEIAVDVSSVNEAGSGPAYVAGSMEQAFHLEGMFTYLPEA